MGFTYYTTFKLEDFFEVNRDNFESILLSEAKNVRGKIDEILMVGNIDLVNNAHKLVSFIIEEKDSELIEFAKQEGIAWATHSLTLSFKLEWIQAIRRSLWICIKKYFELAQEKNIDYLFELEQLINIEVDHFLNEFFISYSKYKDSLINEQKKLVEHLSVPIIPISSTICVLPIIGSVDWERATIIEEKVLSEVGRLHIQNLIVDLSGLVIMGHENIDRLLCRIIDSLILMGCKTIITGVRQELAIKISSSSSIVNQQTKIYGTLQQALRNTIGI